MQMVRTTVSLPVDLHEELREEAFRTRKSLSDVLVQKARNTTDRKKKKDKTASLLREFESIAKEIDRQHKGKDLSDLLIEMRYEQ